LIDAPVGRHLSASHILIVPREVELHHPHFYVFILLYAYDIWAYMIAVSVQEISN
jgi:hypothetical protein